MKFTERKKSLAKHILLYGPPKTGKTLLAGKLSEHFNILHFDLENGCSVFSQLPESWQDKIDVVDIPDNKDEPIAIATMLKVVRGGPVDICVDHGVVNCGICKKKGEGALWNHVHLNALDLNTIVIIDSGTQLTNSAKAHIAHGKSDLYKFEYDDWAALGTTMDLFLGFIQVASYNVIVISHETEAELEDGKLKVVPSFGTRNFSRNSAKYFDEVIYCDIGGGKHVASSSTTAKSKILTGSRSNVNLEKTGFDLAPIFGIGNVEKEEKKSQGAGTQVEASKNSLSKFLKKG